MILRQPTMSDMWHESCRRIFFAKEGQVAKLSSMTVAYDHQLRADSMEFDIDVWRHLHLTKNRFPALQRKYLNEEEYQKFLTRCQQVVKQKGTVTQLNAVASAPRGINVFKKTGNFAKGGCILGWVFRIDKITGQPVFSMHSRTSYIMYLAGLDLALCYCMCKEIGRELGFTVEDFAFRWHVDSLQVSHMQSVAYTYNRPEFMRAIRSPRRYPDAEYPTIKLMRNTVNKFIEKMEAGMDPWDEAYKQMARYRARFESRVKGDGKWPDLPLSKLDLSALHSNRVIEEEDA